MKYDTYINRQLLPLITSRLYKGKGIIIYGARRVGKTTLVHTIMQQQATVPSLYLNCDEPDTRQALTEASSSELKEYIGRAKLVVVDEAQRVPNIGLSLKLLLDTYPDIQVVATGSSAFELSNKVKEPLTGRVYEFHLYPLSFQELADASSMQEEKRLLERRLIYGLYPEIVSNAAEAEEALRLMTDTYLYKDALEYQGIKNPEVIQKLVQALALQIGQEVSYNELARLLEINRDTVMRYIQILEKAFMVFRLRPYHRNSRKELTKLRKIYFYDLGIRNSLIRNLNPLHLRQDVGALWENWLITERLKRNQNSNQFPNMYFWRTHQHQEIDYLEEAGGQLHAYEIKWQQKNSKPPKTFSQIYPEATFTNITKQNFAKFIT